MKKTMPASVRAAQHDLAEGRRRRDDSQAQALENAPSWSEKARTWITDQAAGTELTSTDLTDAVGMPPKSPNAVGAVLMAARRAGLLEKTGAYVQSERPSCHAAVIAVWRRAA